MKLTLLALALVAAQSLMAQAVDKTKSSGFEIGVNGGYVISPLPNAKTDYNNNVKTADGTADKLASSLNVGYHIKNYTVGVSVSTFNLSYWIDPDARAYDGITVLFKSPLVPVQVYANRTFTKNKNEFYTGISGGYILKCTTTYQGGWAPTSTKNSTGVIAGVQFGDTYFLNKHLGINAEIALDYMHLKMNPFTVSAITAPLKAGVRYRF